MAVEGRATGGEEAIPDHRRLAIAQAAQPGLHPGGKGIEADHGKKRA